MIECVGRIPISHSLIVINFSYGLWGYGVAVAPRAGVKRLLMFREASTRDLSARLEVG